MREEVNCLKYWYSNVRSLRECVFQTCCISSFFLYMFSISIYFRVSIVAFCTPCILSVIFTPTWLAACYSTQFDFSFVSYFLVPLENTNFFIFIRFFFAFIWKLVAVVLLLMLPFRIPKAITMPNTIIIIIARQEN